MELFNIDNINKKNKIKLFGKRQKETQTQIEEGRGPGKRKEGRERERSEHGTSLNP